MVTKPALGHVYIGSGLHRVVSDAVIAAQFYREGRMTFFWCAVAIFCIAQVRPVVTL